MAHKQNYLVRITNEWCNRLLGAVSERSLGDQEEQYASHRTRRDFVCTSIGVGMWGMVFPLLTIVVTQLVGAEQAGMFSMAFITGLVLMFMGNYGVRFRCPTFPSDMLFPITKSIVSSPASS